MVDAIPELGVGAVKTERMGVGPRARCCGGLSIRELQECQGGEQTTTAQLKGKTEAAAMR